MSKEGGYKESVFCGLCRAPIKTKALIEGKFDDNEASLRYLPAWLIAGVLTTALTSISSWLSLTGAGLLLTALLRHYVQS